jgi:hypothetical protein
MDGAFEAVDAGSVEQPGVRAGAEDFADTGTDVTRAIARERGAPPGGIVPGDVVLDSSIVSPSDGRANRNR